MRQLLLVALGGAFGSVGRWGVSTWAKDRFGSDFPWGTWFVNVTGSLMLGLVLGLAVAGHLSKPVRTAVGTGMLGAFTTFSTFSCETFAMIEDGYTGRAVANVGANLVVGLLAAWLGFTLSRWLPAPPAAD